jgi:hypothetical protein
MTLKLVNHHDDDHHHHDGIMVATTTTTSLAPDQEAPTSLSLLAVKQQKRQAL